MSAPPSPVISLVLLGDKSETGNGKPGQGLDNVRTEAALATAGIGVVARELSEGRNGVLFIFECSTPSMTTPHPTVDTHHNNIQYLLRACHEPSPRSSPMRLSNLSKVKQLNTG